MLARVVSAATAKHAVHARFSFFRWTLLNSTKKLTFAPLRFMSSKDTYYLDLEKSLLERIEGDDITLKYESEDQLVEGRAYKINFT